EFGPQVQVYFERHRSQLEKLVYSLLRVQDAGIGRELWFRIHEGEATFAELAPAHAGGVEKFTGGIVGPVAARTMHPLLAERLKAAQEGELLKPFTIAKWHLVARLEKRIPAGLDAQLRAAILDELATQRMEDHGRNHGN
ncbi:MAG: peptidylprolyl isomerase, partial [Terrimicrobiaceae bacterium]